MGAGARGGPGTQVLATRPDPLGWALGGILALAPLLPAGPGYAGLPRVSFIDAIVLALLAIWSVGRLEARGRTPRPWPLPMAPWHALLAVSVGATVLALMAEHRFTSEVFIVQFRAQVGDLFRPMHQGVHPFYPLRVGLTFVEGWLVFVLIADLCRRAADPRRRAGAAVVGWLAGFAAVAVFAIVQYATQFGLHPYWVKANPAIVRAHATLDDPNALGAYFVLGIGLLAGLLRLVRGRRRVLWSLLLLGVAGLATTMSRAALGAALTAPFGVLAFTPRPVTRPQHLLRTAGRLMVAVLVIATVTSVLVRLTVSEGRRTQPDDQLELVIKTFDPRESSDWVLRGRLPWWGAAAGMFREHPVTGIGLGRYPRLMQSYGGGRNRENAHNLFLQWFAEAGLIGGVVFGALCVTIWIAFGRLVRRPVTDAGRAWALGGLIGTVAFAMTLLTGHSLLLPSGQILWASFIAVVATLAAAPERVSSAEADPAAGVRPATRRQRLLALMALIAIGGSYPLAGILQGTAPRTDAWGYASGLYAVESAADGTAYRWTAGRARLDIRLPVGATVLELPVAAPGPIRDGVATAVRVTAGSWTSPVILDTADVRTVAIPLADTGLRPGEWLPIEILVSPTFVPARGQPGGDQRTLGIQVLRPRLIDDAGHPRR